jgi:hypothetical protein
MNPDVFSGLDYLPSHLTEIPQTGDDFGSVDEQRRLRDNIKQCPHRRGVP